MGIVSTYFGILCGKFSHVKSISEKKCGKWSHVVRMTAHDTEMADRLHAALQRIFRPLVRLFIARSIPYRSISNVLRGVYVDVAVKEFPVADKRQTDSRITLLTGIHRKDVKRWRGQRQAPLRAPGPLRSGRS